MTRLGALLLALPFAGCTCGAGNAQLAGVDVAVDEDSLTLSRAGVTLLELLPTRIGFKDGSATYDMQFGMFDIREDFNQYTFASRFNVFASGADAVAFTVQDASGADVVAGRVVAASSSGGGAAVVVELTAATGNRMFAGGPCALEHALGFGAQTYDVDHKGQVVPLWVSEQGVGTSDSDELPALWQVLGRRHTSYAPIPAFITNRGAAVVVDTTAFTRVDVCSAAELTFEVFQPTLSLRVFAGASPREAQAKLVDDVGRPPLPPPWTLAPWNDAIFGSDSVRAYAQRLRDEDIPSSALWSEDWRGGEAVGTDGAEEQYRLDEDWRLDEALYPGFADMVSDVNALGFHELVYFNTFVTEGGDVFDEITSQGFAIDAPTFLGVDRDISPTTLIDLTNSDARAYMKGHLEGALALGVRGWMADFAEWFPVQDVLSGEKTQIASGADAELAHNTYPIEWARVNREVADDSAAAGDIVIFHRSAWHGSQPLVSVLWAGDQRTTFDVDDGLPTILPIGIGLSAVGFPFFAHDVAGYQSATNDPVDKELFTRWTELGAFSPVMRTHHGTHAFLNVNVFTDDDTIAHWKRYAELHIRLYPYLRSLARDAVEPGGLPLWVPLPLLFPADDAVWTVQDQVMLGPSLLIAPVVTQGATSRAVTLPSARFALFPFTNVTMADTEGPGVVDADAPLGEIPVLVVAGGIVPMTATPADTLLPNVAGLDSLESTEGDRVVVVATGAAGAFTEESGASYTLTGDGIANEDVTLTGDDVYAGDGFTFTLEGHPASRTTTVLFR